MLYLESKMFLCNSRQFSDTILLYRKKKENENEKKMFGNTQKELFCSPKDNIGIVIDNDDFLNY